MEKDAKWNDKTALVLWNSGVSWIRAFNRRQKTNIECNLERKTGHVTEELGE